MPSTKKEDDPLISEIRLRRDRRDRWLHEGDLSISRRLAQIGVLGWIFIAPTLMGLFFGRWLDVLSGTGIFWTVPVMVIGVCIGAYTAWKWMNAP